MANPRKTTSGSWFTNLANASAAAVGSPAAFIFAAATVIAWLRDRSFTIPTPGSW
jgi:low affinity Fe/Cu permease